MKKILLVLVIPLLMGASCSLFGGDKGVEKSPVVNQEAKQEDIKDEAVEIKEDVDFLESIRLKESDLSDNLKVAYDKYREATPDDDDTLVSRLGQTFINSDSSIIVMITINEYTSNDAAANASISNLEQLNKTTKRTIVSQEKIPINSSLPNDGTLTVGKKQLLSKNIQYDYIYFGHIGTYSVILDYTFLNEEVKASDIRQVIDLINSRLGI